MTVALADEAVTLRSGHRPARREGLVSAVTELTAAVAGGAIVYGPAGHAIVPAAVARDATTVWIDGVVAERDTGRETLVRQIGLGPDTLIALRHTPSSASSLSHAPAEWLAGLAWMRLGLSESLLDACTAYLGARSSGDTPLLLQQMVRGAVADALTEQLEVRAVLDGLAADDLPISALTDLNRQITGADRLLLRLLGAGGFLADGPGQTAHVSALIADAYTGEVTT